MPESTTRNQCLCVLFDTDMTHYITEIRDEVYIFKKVSSLSEIKQVAFAENNNVPRLQVRQ